MAIRWRGYGHPELYKMINDGPGAAASEPQTQYWKTLTDELTQVDEDLNAKLKDMGAAWEGDAAQRAQAGMTPLAEWANDAEIGSTVMKISSENQAEYISDGRASMPEPVPVTTPAPSGWQMAAAAASAATFNPVPALAVASQAADHEAQEQAQAEAEQRAVQTMQTYESNSTANRETLGTFVKPPDVVIATDPPRGGTQTFVAGPESATGANAGAGSQSTAPSGAAIPNGGGGGAGAGTLTPVGGGSAAPSPGGQVPVGSGAAIPPASTTPQGLLPTPSGQPPIGGPPLQPGPGANPPIGPNNPGLGQNQLLPGFSNTSNPNAIGNGGNGPLNNSGNRGPVVGARPPLNPGIAPVGNNASDVARRAQPLRPGLPGGFGGVTPDGSRSAAQYGRGGFGAVPGAGAAVGNGPGAATAAGGRGSAANGVRGPVSGPGGRGGMVAPMGAGGRRADREDDEERFAPDYLLETEDVFGDDRRVVPGVIGESAPQDA
jgi:hypothetical protein